MEIKDILICSYINVVHFFPFFFFNWQSALAGIKKNAVLAKNASEMKDLGKPYINLPIRSISDKNQWINDL